MGHAVRAHFVYGIYNEYGHLYRSGSCTDGGGDHGCSEKEGGAGFSCGRLPCTEYLFRAAVSVFEIEGAFGKGMIKIWPMCLKPLLQSIETMAAAV